MIKPRRVQGGVVGVAVGDALGLPVVGGTRAERRQDPVSEMRSGGLYEQAEGTWSDETSLTLCTIEALLDQYSPTRLGEVFSTWLQDGHWTPHGNAFAADPLTEQAVERIIRGGPPQQSGSVDPAPGLRSASGVVRILPIAIAFCRRSIPVMLDRIYEAASLTHPHPLYLMACGFAGLITRNLLHNRPPRAAYRYAAEHAREIYLRDPWREYRPELRRLLRGTVGDVTAEQIPSGSTVAALLEGSIWSLVTTKGYKECLYRAINLGGRTDEIGAIAGGLAGIAHGMESIPTEWVDALACGEDLLRLSERFARVTTA